MIAVTIGVGKYSKMAHHAAAALSRYTGLSTLVLGDDHYARMVVPNPLYLKFRLFDCTDEDELLHFDADLVCLRPWDPLAMREEEAVVCVRDRMWGNIREE